MRPVSRYVAWLAATLAAATATLHVVALIREPHSALGTVAMATMVVACLWCAAHLWWGRSQAALALATGMNLVMLAGHGGMLAAVGCAHQHGGTVPLSPDTPMSGVMVAGMTVAAAEVAVGAAVLLAEFARQRGPVLGSHASGHAAEKGSIEAGNRANVLLMDRDSMACADYDLRHLRALRTYFAGGLVHQADTRATSEKGQLP